MTRERFPEGFIFGASTSAYQIEGAWNEGGKGESIWDRFAHTPGAIEDGATGDVACDHVHRFAEDVALMRRLGLDAYRFSIAWPRILPAGGGQVNPAGVAFYDRLIDALLEEGIEPVPTLYHWDLPQALQDQGGWPERAIVDRFCEYALAVVRALGDRVTRWSTLNEPYVSAFIGYLEGRHAPGHRSEAEALAAVHHLLLAHGRATSILREETPKASIGIVLNLSPIYPASDRDEDRRAAARLDGLVNRTFLDPLSGHGYPEVATYDCDLLASFVEEGDLREIAVPLDFLGFNYYAPQVAEASPVPGEQPTVRPNAQKTRIGWEIYPEGLFELLERLDREYAFPELLVTENGAAYADRVGPDGRVDDAARIAYLKTHLEQCRRAIESGIPLAGYFVWSLLDNFEWSLGYGPRFGLVYVDFETQRRTPKASFEWYRRVIADRGTSPLT
jgi:beta-glucosidase